MQISGITHVVYVTHQKVISLWKLYQHMPKHKSLVTKDKYKVNGFPRSEFKQNRRIRFPG